MNEKIIKEGIEKLKGFNLKDDKKFTNFNYDSIILSKAFLYYYDKLISRSMLLESFKDINTTELRRLVEDYENSIMRKPIVRKNITRIIEPYKDLMVFFVSVIENSEGKEGREEEELVKDFL